MFRHLKIKKMKYNYIIAFLITGLMFTSCGEDFLSPTPDSAVSAAGFYTNE